MKKKPSLKTIIIISVSLVAVLCVTFFTRPNFRFRVLIAMMKDVPHGSKIIEINIRNISVSKYYTDFEVTAKLDEMTEDEINELVDSLKEILDNEFIHGKVDIKRDNVEVSTIQLSLYEYSAEKPHRIFYHEYDREYYPEYKEYVWDHQFKQR